MEPLTAPGLEVVALRKHYRSGGLFGRRSDVVAAEDVSFQVARGETVAVVGESGSGKSTIARLLLRLERPDSGAVRLGGTDVLAREPHGASRGYRRRVQMVFQDPFGSLNPAHDVAHHLLRPMQRLSEVTRDHAALRERALELLRTVGLTPAEEFLHRRPYELSGGQRQRVAIARALAAEPELLIADEPTSMLDVSLRLGLLQLLQQLQRERGLAILLITHDLTAARFLASRLVVLYRGRVVETGDTETVVRAPAHPYTRALLDAVARLEPGVSPRVPAGAPAGETGGCPFAPRCPLVFERCRREEPGPRVHDGRIVRCHLHEGERPA